MNNFKWFYFLLIVFLFPGCEEQELDIEPEADLTISEKLHVCEPIEKVKTVEDVNGMVLYDEWLGDYVISRGIDGTYDSVDVGFICDLPKEYRKHGTKIIFSGVYLNIDEERKKIIPTRIIGVTYYILEVDEIKLRESPN